MRRYWQKVPRNMSKVRRYVQIMHKNKQKVRTRIAPNPTIHNWEGVLRVCRLDVPFLRHRLCAKPSPIQLGS